MGNYSRQREEILQAVKDNLIHPTAEDIYTIIKANDSTASMSTVYRNLNLLVSQKVIRRIEVPNGSDRFDSNITPHQHITCKKCGKISDVFIDISMESLKEEVAKQSDMELTGYQLMLEGICGDCQDKEYN